MSVILEAHRGAASDYPENTLVAMKAAVALGYGMIELDTKFTADNRCVILHDRTLARTARRADGSRIEDDVRVENCTLEALKGLDFGRWQDEKFAGEPIPTLEEVLELALETRVPLKFDNVLQSHTPEQQEILFATAEKMGALDVAGFTTNSVEFAGKILERLPSAQIHYDGAPDAESIAAITSIVPPSQLTVWLRYHNERTAWCRTPAVTPELAAEVKKHARIGLWLLTRPEELRDAEALGADFVETDGSLRP